MIRLSCENEFCVYQKEGTCVLGKVQLDIQGNCTDCVYVNIEKDTLKKLKEKFLR